MTDKQTIRDQLDALVRNAHQYACSLEIGDERTDAFELYEVLRRLQRRGAASQMLAATNPLLVDHDSIDLTAEQYKSLAQEVAPNSNHPESPDSWAACQAIADLPEVDSALRELVEDSTGDNGVRVVQAVLRTLAGSPEIAHG